MSEQAGMTYKSAGVDNSVKERVSRLFYDASKKTWVNRKGRIGEIKSGVDSFSGYRSCDFSNLKDAEVGMGNDGIGTKQVIAQRLSTYTGDYSCHRGLPKDLLAMVVDDSGVRGAESILVTTTFNFNTLGENHVKLAEHLAQGMIEAANDARVAIFSGETADLGDVVGGYGNERYIADATALWVANTKRAITGKNLKPGIPLVAYMKAVLGQMD